MKIFVKTTASLPLHDFLPSDWMVTVLIVAPLNTQENVT